jgi:hypothetical protein
MRSIRLVADTPTGPMGCLTRPEDPKTRGRGCLTPAIRPRLPGWARNAPATGRPARMDFAQTKPVKAGGRDYSCLTGGLKTGGLKTGGLKMCQPHGLLTGNEDSPSSGPPRGLAGAIAPAMRCAFHTPAGGQRPRPAPGPPMAGAGLCCLCCTCANGPYGAVVASRAGKRGAFPDPPGLAAPFPGSGR